MSEVGESHFFDNRAHNLNIFLYLFIYFFNK